MIAACPECAARYRVEDAEGGRQGCSDPVRQMFHHFSDRFTRPGSRNPRLPNRRMQRGERLRARNLVRRASRELAEGRLVSDWPRAQESLADRSRFSAESLGPLGP